MWHQKWHQNKEKPPKTIDFSGVFWRRRWDSNPRRLSPHLISSQARYDHFDTSPNMPPAKGVYHYSPLTKSKSRGIRRSHPSAGALKIQTQPSQGTTPKEHGPTWKKATPRVLPWGSQRRVSQACKPSSVVDGHLSRPTVTGRLQRLPGSAAGHRIFPSILHQVGFASRTSRQAAGELLPRLSILTSQRDAVYFCCTFLGVASTGDYPAPCPMELGLSSSAKAAAAIRLTHTCCLFYHNS